jgi:hypothetical protein
MGRFGEGRGRRSGEKKKKVVFGNAADGTQTNKEEK